MCQIRGGGGCLCEGGGTVWNILKRGEIKNEGDREEEIKEDGGGGGKLGQGVGALKREVDTPLQTMCQFSGREKHTLTLFILLITCVLFVFRVYLLSKIKLLHCILHEPSNN